MIFCRIQKDDPKGFRWLDRFAFPSSQSFLATRLESPWVILTFLFSPKLGSSLSSFSACGWCTMALRRQGWGSWVVLGIFISLGSASIQAYLHPKHPPSHVSQFNGTGRIALEGTIDRPPHRTPRGTQLLIRSSEVIVSNRHGQVDWMSLPCRAGSFIFQSTAMCFSLFRVGQNRFVLGTGTDSCVYCILHGAFITQAGSLTNDTLPFKGFTPLDSLKSRDG